MSIFSQGSLASRCSDERCAELLGSHYFYFARMLPPALEICVITRGPYELSVSLRGPDRKYGVVVKRVVDLLLNNKIYAGIPCDVLEKAAKNI